jgi:DNA-binding GntR family transcriptional regulator
MGRASPSVNTLASDLASRVRSEVIHGVLPPGSKLRTQELAARYGVSLIPMREALSRLASSGFVRAEDQRGFRVTEVSAAELKDITRTRVFVEREALRLSLECGDLGWESDLIAAHHRMNRTPVRAESQPGDSPQWEEAHDEFHRALIAGCDSKWLLSVASMLREQTARYRHLASRARELSKSPRSVAVLRDVTAEHAAILQAALQRDSARAMELLERHLQTTAESVLEHYTDDGEGRLQP